MGVVDKLNQIKSCKEDIKQAIINKGVDMTDVAFTEYATKISEIQAGGGDYFDIRANMSTYYSTTEIMPAYAFAYMGGLTSVNLPKCRYVGSYAFLGCSSLTSANFPNCKTLFSGAFQSCSSLTSANFPNCETVRGSAFTNCKSLQLINLPKCIEMADCFEYCSSLQSIDLPNCIIVGSYTFNSCSSLQSANVPICANIFNNAFSGCSTLSVLDLRSTYSCGLPNSNAFSRTPFASGIGSIYVHNTVLSQFQNATNWTYFSKCMVGVGDPDRPLLAFDNGRVYGDTGVIFSNTYLSFLNIKSSSITSVDLPNCSSVGSSTFYSCSSLQTVNLPMCEYMGSNAFSYCLSLQTVNLHNLRTVYKYMFYTCSFLQSIDLTNCEYIDTVAFYRCTSLQSIDLPNCSYVGYAAFSGCSSLQSVNLPNCSYVGENAFSSCTSLQSIDLPNCSYVGSFTFYGCSSLQSVNLPMCEYVGGDAFYTYNNTIDTVYIGTSISKVCQAGGAQIFANNNTNGGYLINKIFVPMSLVDAYKSATTWSNYASKIFGI